MNFFFCSFFELFLLEKKRKLFVCLSGIAEMRMASIHMQVFRNMKPGLLCALTCVKTR